MSAPLWPDMMRRWQAPPVMVLLVEDDPLVREVMTEMLADRGHRVIACRDGDAFLAALPEADETVVLLTDVLLPGRSGRALADEFRRRHPGRPILFATGLPEDRLPPLRPDETLLLKPFRPDQMFAALDRATAAS